MENEDIWKELCSFENLKLAWRRARKGKTKKLYVIEFEKNTRENLLALRSELMTKTYFPKPLKTFILRDPKTRKISKSEFRDRVVHHALVNILEPIFEKHFIADSCANRKGKGTLYALRRFEKFKRKISKNNTSKIFVLKADIYHYFNEVNHSVLLLLIKRKVKDENILSLIEKINANFEIEREAHAKYWNAFRQFNISIFC